MKRQLFINDNLPVLRCMDDDSVDLIYLDPPFNSGKQWEAPIKGNRGRAVAAFKDTWTLSDTHIDELHLLAIKYRETKALIDSLYKINGGSWRAYLIYMGARLAEMRRILKPSGSIYYHCDPTMSHGVKLLMDAIFGEKNFRNEISWSYHRFSRQSARQFAKMHDTLLFYSKTSDNAYNPLFVEKRESDPSIRRGFVVRRKDRKVLVYDREKFAAAKPGLDVEGYKISDCSDLKVKMGTVWNIPFIHALAKERTGYPTQKPPALLDRVVAASSNEGDVVLDPFCGCGTALVAAQKLGRQWIGIDISDEAARILRDQLPLLGQSADGLGVEEFIRKLPKRTDLPPMTDKATLRQRLYDSQNGRCAMPCEDGKIGRELDARDIQFDHKLPRERGGQDEDGNMQLLCGDCNRRKSGKSVRQFREEVMRRETERAVREYRAQLNAEIDKLDGGAESK